MATRGRKPKPTAIKLLEGNPGKRPLNRSGPVPPDGGVDCPAWLLPEAKKAWARIASLLTTLGLLTLLDVTALAGYCQTYARWKHAKKQLSQSGDQIPGAAGKPQPNPYLAIESKCAATMKSLATGFGIKHDKLLEIISAGDMDAGADPSDPMERLLTGGWQDGV